MYVINISAFIMAELIKTKSESVTLFRSFLRKIRLLGYKVYVIRIDNDFVFQGADFKDVCQEFDIFVQRSVPFRHHQLGRMNDIVGYYNGYVRRLYA